MIALGGCPTIDSYCEWLQILMAALLSPKRPQRRPLLRLRPFWPCRLALKIFTQSCYGAILGQPPRPPLKTQRSGKLRRAADFLALCPVQSSGHQAKHPLRPPQAAGMFTIKQPISRFLKETPMPLCYIFSKI